MSNALQYKVLLAATVFYSLTVIQNYLQITMLDKKQFKFLYKLQNSKFSFTNIEIDNSFFYGTEFKIAFTKTINHSFSYSITLLLIGSLEKRSLTQML